MYLSRFLIIIFLFLTISFTGRSVFGQNDSAKAFFSADGPNRVFIEAEPLAVGIGYSRFIKPWLQPGLSYKFGIGYHYLWNKYPGFNMREHSIWALFNRTEITNYFTLDYGIRFGYITVVDKNPKHGFSHLSMTGGYLQALVGRPFLSAGFRLVASYNSYFSLYNTLLLQSEIRF